MQEWLYQFVTGGGDFILWVQTWQTPFLTSFFQVMTYLGVIEAYLIIAPLFYWLLHKPFGLRLAYLLMISGYSNLFLKNVFKLPRPYQVDPNIIKLHNQAGYGLPSGHAQVPTAMWGYIAWYWRKQYRWLIPLAIVLALAIAFSRIYLGVHYPADTIAGLIIGLIILVLWLKFEPPVSAWLSQQNGWVIIPLSLGISAAMIFLTPGDFSGYPAEDAVTMSAIVAGVSIGAYYEREKVRFETSGTWKQKVLRYLLGMILVGVCYLGLKVGFGLLEAGHSVDLILRFIRYSIVGCAFTWWAPALFVRLGLAKGRAPESAS